jgi:cytosine/adenosine deaminase-related metal-dependent hydrolase
MLTIRNVSLLNGDDFQLISNGFIEIEGGTIRVIGQGEPTTSDRALGLVSPIGSLKAGKQADVVFLNLNSPSLRFSKDLIASIVHRTSPEDVEGVMVGGDIVHGSIPTIANPQ